MKRRLLWWLPALLLLAPVGACSPSAEPEARTFTGLAAVPQAEFQAPAASAQAPAQGGSAARPAATRSLVVRDIVVRDLDGRIAWRGDVDLRPVLQRIAAGRRDPHRNDGGVFGNRERQLPEQRRGYYREYVIRTAGITHAGPQRLVLGAGGEVYYTPDHYRTFRRVR